jgi:MraZ protein
LWEKVGESGAPAFTPGVPSLKEKVEQMFLGQYQHSLDSKGRLTIPVRYRELVAEGAYITQGFDRNLMVLTAAAFHNMSERVNQMSVTNPEARSLRRLIFSRGERVEVDRAGRILIPQFLREAAGLEGEAMVVGAGDFFEIWSPENWDQQSVQLEDPEANAQRFINFNIASG